MAVTLEEQRQAEYEMQQRLESIPLSKYYPTSRHEALDRVIEALETRINKLTAFVRFLSLKTLEEYYEWMKQAFARYVPTKAPVQTNMMDEEEYSFAESEVSLSKKPGKKNVAKNTLGKRKRFTLG